MRSKFCAFLACLALVACKHGGTPRTSASTLRGDEATPPAEGAAPTPTPTSSPERPIIIVAGWGGQAVSYTAFLGYLMAAGVPRDRIDIIYYPFMNSFETSITDIERQLSALLDGKYRGVPKVDVFGVSTGHFVGLYALMKGGWSTRVQKYVGIVGVGHGITAAHIPTPLRTVECPGFWCGGTLGRLAPLNNALVRDFYRQYHGRIDALDKCSVFAATASPATQSDGVITPPDSGRFDGPYDSAATGGAFAAARATVVAVPGLTHLTSITDRRYFVDLVRGCYGAAWPLPPDWGGTTP